MVNHSRRAVQVARIINAMRYAGELKPIGDAMRSNMGTFNLAGQFVPAHRIIDALADWATDVIQASEPN